MARPRGTPSTGDCTGHNPPERGQREMVPCGFPSSVRFAKSTTSPDCRQPALGAHAWRGREWGAQMVIPCQPRRAGSRAALRPRLLTLCADLRSPPGGRRPATTRFGQHRCGRPTRGATKESPGVRSLRRQVVCAEHRHLLSLPPRSPCADLLPQPRRASTGTTRFGQRRCVGLHGGTPRRSVRMPHALRIGTVPCLPRRTQCFRSAISGRDGRGRRVSVSFSYGEARNPARRRATSPVGLSALRLGLRFASAN